MMVAPSPPTPLWMVVCIVGSAREVFTVIGNDSLPLSSVQPRSTQHSAESCRPASQPPWPDKTINHLSR